MKIYNSLTRKKEEFSPVRKGKVGMYVCGPTVYDEPHIGHARSAYIFDVIKRYLEYRGYRVMFVRNVTDVDDKIIEKARSIVGCRLSVVGLVDSVKDISKKYLDAYHDDMALLGIGKPDKEPKATGYIPKMIEFIELLVKKGCAYEADGDVYFDIRKAKDYGKLSNQNLEKMEVGARIAPGEKKIDPLDFALWKRAKEDEPSWPSPWGEGRPGWHIECSVMSSDILGDEFDIHGGGIDLIFPHHENEIAQSEGAGKRFAKFWIHNGLLTINGEKMAKSLGNFISITGFLAQYNDPDYLKLFFLSAHYRSPIDYTDEKIEMMKKEKERFFILFEKMDQNAKVKSQKSKLRCPSDLNIQDHDLGIFRKKFEEAMDDDFNTPLAVAALFDLVTYANKVINDKDRIAGVYHLLKSLSSVFGLNLAETPKKDGDDKIIKGLIDERNRARRARDFKKSDEIRKALLEKHAVILEDTKEGTVWRRRL